MKYWISLLLVLFSFYSVSQTIDIQGRVEDEQGDLPGATITVLADSSSKINNYAIADADGQFWIKNVDTTLSHIIRARLIGYKDMQLLLDTNFFVFQLRPTSVHLDEVKIKAPKISGVGDTTLYVASAFAKENDVTLGDVIKRMPDFEVSKEGKLKYQGKDISKFYIEGSNIMGDNYNIAVNSIHQQDVGSVEVIENHQDIRLFEDMLFSDHTAVNINLKEKAKRQWTGFVNLGVGLPGIWQGDINLMRFAKKIKMLNTYKANNTGVDVSAIAQPIFVADNVMITEDAPMFIHTPFVHNPYIETKKTLFNTSYLLSLNSQTLLSKTLSLTPQLNIGMATLNNQILEEQTYFLNNKQRVTISSNVEGLQKQWKVSPIVSLEANTKHLYFSNILSSNIIHKQTDLSISGCYPNRENSNMDYQKFKDDLSAMFKWGHNIVGLKSVNSWSSRPQYLQILRDTLHIDQDIITSVFNSQSSLSQSFLLGRATFSIDEGYAFAKTILRSSVAGIDYHSFENDFTYNKCLLYVKPSLSVGIGSVKLFCSLPFNYNINTYVNQLQDTKYFKNKVLWSYTGRALWTINRKYELSIVGAWEALPEVSNHFYSQSILSTYPNFQQGILAFHNAENTKVSIRLRYKNILKGVFWNLFYSKSWKQGNLMPLRYFDMPYIVLGLVHNPHNTKQDMVSSNISYMSELINGDISIKGTYLHSDAHLLQANKVQYSTSSFSQLAFDILSEPLRYILVDYTVTYALYKHQMEQRDALSDYNITQKLSCTFKPYKKLNIEFTANYYKNYIDKKAYNTYLIDADINYNCSSRWRFKLSTQNILNQKEFRYKYYTAMMAIERKYKIRPFSVLFTVITYL